VTTHPQCIDDAFRKGTKQAIKHVERTARRNNKKTAMGGGTSNVLGFLRKKSEQTAKNYS